MNPKSFCRGVLLGGLVGDCLGFNYVGVFPVDVGVPAQHIVDIISKAWLYPLSHTDDTGLALGFLQSVREKGAFVIEDVENSLPHRPEYPGPEFRIGDLLPGSRILDEIIQLSSSFVDDSGIYSVQTGGAMRICALTVFALNLPITEFETMVISTTRLTHTHPLSICGALLQAFAVRRVWQAVAKDGSQPVLDGIAFLDGLLEDLRRVSDSFVDFKVACWEEAYGGYAEKFSEAKKLLQRETVPEPSEVGNILGNNLEAVNSVPTAIFVFLQSVREIPGINLTSIPLRCLAYAVCTGSRTDVITTMACCLAGGYVGLPEDAKDPCLPKVLLLCCEKMNTLSDYASWLGDRLAG